MSHLSGVYRQRSYDNLQNGKSPYRKSVKSLHLPPTYGVQNYQNCPSNHGNNLNNSNEGVGSNGSIINYAQLSPIMHFAKQQQQQHHHHLNQIPSNLKYFAPQSKYQGGGYDSNSLPRYPYHKNRAVSLNHPSIHQQNFCQQNYMPDHSPNSYKYPIVRHPTTPPPPPPAKRNSMMEEQGLLVTTPTSSSSSNDCSNSEFSELDQMLPAQVQKRGFENIPHYRTCKKQLQQATQMLNNQQQYYIDNYMQQYNQSPYRRYLNASASHMNVQSAPNQPNFNQNKRLSNVYEYQLTNFDLKAIREDPPNDT